MLDILPPEYDAVVVGGGPAGATAAEALARAGRSVLLLDRAGRPKPCGGAVPPKLLEEFAVDEALLCARITAARVVSPRNRHALMPIANGGFVGMVDRADFDEWLRVRAARSGAERCTASFERVERDAAGGAVVAFRTPDGAPGRVRARVVVGADGARSAVALQCVPGADAMPYVFAFHEIVRSPTPAENGDFNGARCDVYYGSAHSPDFYGWVFPHGATTSVGLGSARKGFAQRRALDGLRRDAGLSGAETVRREGAPIPMKPLRRWENGRDVVLAGDAAGVVAPASGEGIYYAMLGGRLAGEAAAEFLRTGNARALKSARRRFMRAHGRVFRMLGLMQRFWYANDDRRERFCAICRDPDVQHLTWAAY
ncbi:MAG: geranylgeranyl diphosphate reductase, partial [Gluconacetobacter diazotrophicus]|nr:geranylgeranyl diphosphate reductase [Gluconacetobacter diazotrophicus]